MPRELLIYDRIESVTFERHGNWSVDVGQDYSFARSVNSVPLMTVEFSQAAVEYPIVFSGQGDHLMPTVILGMREAQNEHVSEGGQWDAKYIPAFVRRYPFVFSSDDEGQTFTLCIDEFFAGCNTEDRGERLFDAQGEQTTYLKRVLEFLQSYQFEYQRTQTFCRRLHDRGLLETMVAELTTEQGEQSSLTGFQMVQRERLKELPGDRLVELVQSDHLELVYLHLQSMLQLEFVGQRP